MAATATPTITDTQRALVASALAEREAHAPCPACGPLGEPTVEGWLINLPITHAADRLTFAEQIPVAVVICGNCGHVRLHAVGTLGLLEALSAAAHDDPAAVVDLADAGPDDEDEDDGVDTEATTLLPSIPAPARPADDPANLTPLDDVRATEAEPAPAG